MCRNHTICLRTAHVASKTSLLLGWRNFCEHLLGTGTGLRDGDVGGIKL